MENRGVLFCSSRCNCITLFEKEFKKKILLLLLLLNCLIKMPDLKSRQLLCDKKQVVIRHRTVWKSDSVATLSKNIAASLDQTSKLCRIKDTVFFFPCAGELNVLFQFKKFWLTRSSNYWHLFLAELSNFYLNIFFLFSEKGSIKT